MVKPVDELKYMDDDPGTCPYCHSNLLVVGKKLFVECPICAIKGDLKVEGDKIAVAWYEDDIRKILWEPLGKGNISMI